MYKFSKRKSYLHNFLWLKIKIIFAKSERSLPSHSNLLQVYCVTYLGSPSVQLNIFFNFCRCTWSSPWNPLLSIVSAKFHYCFTSRAALKRDEDFRENSRAKVLLLDSTTTVHLLFPRHPALASRWKLNKLFRFLTNNASRWNILNNQIKSHFFLAYSKQYFF